MPEPPLLKGKPIMNTLLLEPTDVLFFRDGRPMGGSLSGHGGAWPLPTVTNAALHAALHRADLENAFGGKLHGHDHHRRDGQRIADVRKFGSLVTAGPFPVMESGDWLFPRPLDTGVSEKAGLDSTAVTFQPLEKDFRSRDGSLPEPLKCPVAAKLAPTKATPSPWWTKVAWDAYLKGTELMAAKPAESSTTEAAPDKKPIHFHQDKAFADTEFSYGIGIDAATGTQDGERFYSAHYLRLKPGCRLGLFAEARDKDFQDKTGNNDLVATLFPNSGAETPVIVGGQQRLCTVRRERMEPLPLPMGKTSDFEQKDNGGNVVWCVKWVLLTPAIYPKIDHHSGGWLPSWIRHTDGRVMLKSGETARREREGREAWRNRVTELPNIDATLVAALVGKPLAVTGYALPHEKAERAQGAAKPTQLAVPAGSVYYFTCTSEDAAVKLAAALNWHGGEDDGASRIKNRRSTLMGEKGFGLGVCGAWRFHNGDLPRTAP